MASKDRELEAISAIMSQLAPLDEIARGRVLEYVLKRLDMRAVGPAREAGPSTELANSGGAVGAGTYVKDIRTLAAEKQPRSANEMVALIGYYLSELAPEDQRSDRINVETVKRYFKMAAFPMPRVPKSALTNAAAAGYLENVSRGEYRLNPVGYNLVVHGLPRGGAVSQASPGRKTKKGTRRRRG